MSYRNSVGSDAVKNKNQHASLSRGPTWLKKHYLLKTDLVVVQVGCNVIQNKVAGNGRNHELNTHLPSACSGLGIMLSPINVTENKTILYSLRSLQSNEGDVH